MSRLPVTAPLDTDYRLPLGPCGLPTNAYRRSCDYRRILEAEVRRIHGRIDRRRAEQILRACAALQEVLRWQLRLAGKDLSPETVMGYSDRRLRSMDRWERFVDALGLDPDTTDPWQQLRLSAASEARQAAAAMAADRRAGQPAADAPAATTGVSGDSGDSVDSESIETSGGSE